MTNLAKRYGKWLGSLCFNKENPFYKLFLGFFLLFVTIIATVAVVVWALISFGTLMYSLMGGLGILLTVVILVSIIATCVTKWATM